jgi:hypothetical protein
VPKIPERRNLSEERFTELIVSEGLVHACLATCTWAENHGAGALENAHLTGDRKRSPGKGLGTLKGTVQWPTSSN